MESLHKSILNKKRVDLVCDMDPKLLKNDLVAVGLLHDRNEQELDSRQTDQAKNEYILEILKTKGPAAFRDFLAVLRKFPRQKHLAQSLSKETNEEVVPTGALSCQDLPSVFPLCSSQEKRAKEVATDLTTTTSSKNTANICWISGPLGSGKSAFGKFLLDLLARSIDDCSAFRIKLKTHRTVAELVEEIVHRLELQESGAAAEERLELELKRRESVVFLFDNCDRFLQNEGHKPFLELISKFLQQRSVISLITTCFRCPTELEKVYPVTVRMLQKEDAAELLSSYHCNSDDNLQKAAALFCGMPFPLVALGRETRRKTAVQKYYNKLSPQYKFLQNFHRILPSEAEELTLYFNERLHVLTENGAMLTVLRALAVIPGRFSWSFGSDILGHEKAANFKDYAGKLLKRNLLLKNGVDRYEIPELLRQHLRDETEVDHSQAFKRYSKIMMKNIKAIAELDKKESQKATEKVYKCQRRLTEFLFRATLEKGDVCQFAEYFATCPPLRTLPYSVLHSFYKKAISVPGIDKVWKAAFRLLLADIALEDVSCSPTKQTLTKAREHLQGTLFLEKDIDLRPSWLQKLYWKIKAVVELASGDSCSEKDFTISEKRLISVPDMLSDEWNLLARARYAAAANKPQSRDRKECFNLVAAHYSAAVAKAKEEGNHTVRFPAEVRLGECFFKMGKYTDAKKKFTELLDSKKLKSVNDYVTCHAALLYSKELAQIGDNVSKKKENFWRYEELKSASNVLETALYTFEEATKESDGYFHPLRLMIIVAVGKVALLQGLVAAFTQQKSEITYFDQAVRYFSSVGQFEDNGEVVNILKSEADSFLSIVRTVKALACRNDVEFSKPPIALTGAKRAHVDKAVKLFLDSSFNVITDIGSLFAASRLNSSESFDVLFRFSFLYSDAVEGRRKRELLECIDSDDDSDDSSSVSDSDSDSDSDEFKAGSVDVLTGETQLREPRLAYGNRSPNCERKTRVFYDSFETTPTRRRKVSVSTFAVQETAGTVTSSTHATITLPQSHLATESLETEESAKSPPTLEQAEAGDSKN